MKRLLDFIAYLCKSVLTVCLIAVMVVAAIVKIGLLTAVAVVIGGAILLGALIVNFIARTMDLFR